MEDISTLCLLGIFLIVGFMLLSRFMGGGRGFPGGGMRGRGPEYPRVDDPDISSSGGFGNRPGRRGGGLFPGGGRGGRSGGPPGRQGGPLFPPRGGGGSRRSSGRNDDPDINSRGGFGRSG